MLSMRGKLILTVPISSGILLSKFPTSATEKGCRGGGDLPLSTKYVTLSYSFGLSYEPCTTNSNKEPYLEGKIILLSNLRLKFPLYEVQLSVLHAMVLLLLVKQWIFNECVLYYAL